MQIMKMLIITFPIVCYVKLILQLYHKILFNNLSVVYSQKKDRNKFLMCQQIDIIDLQNFTYN